MLARDHRPFFSEPKRSAPTTELYRRGYWDRRPLAQSAQLTDNRHRDVDWRARYRAEAAKYRVTDPTRAKAIERIGWRLFCRQARIEGHESALVSLSERQTFDELLWDQLTAGAATDDVEAAERESGVRHG